MSDNSFKKFFSKLDILEGSKKDRVVPIENKLIESLREYFLNYRPKDWLFEIRPLRKYSERRLQKVLKKTLILQR